uniref:Uncharacterized protein n=1 Tax=Romanomermis culicivorax TaxID=13658 RepID=A0A915JXF9_ROMCU
MQRRDMQNYTVGCRFDRTNKMMYYFIKFGRYATWSLEDTVEMVVRYADNKYDAGQQQQSQPKFNDNL